MARAATTTDAFNAIAEPRRRDIIEALACGPRNVGQLVDVLGQSQPLVSKHLRVLREVGIVRVTDRGRQRFYELDANALRPVHAWTSRFERLWNERFDRMDEVLARLDDEG
ncbi:ArsR/SmtB family transcription factor [Nocardia arizonensis]|uniref:ArsR/SmtB family transcription factor n=1 Tax=Nocardia arizonensis TaxID=1141647 RepID=UPI0006D095CB|nr:metalloregulator ArsR/SmtB family transcription factor [Nocardia arizonensis]